MNHDSVEENKQDCTEKNSSEGTLITILRLQKGARGATAEANKKGRTCCVGNKYGVAFVEKKYLECVFDFDELFLPAASRLSEPA
jgi:hypothetical protein